MRYANPLSRIDVAGAFRVGFAMPSSIRGPYEAVQQIVLGLAIDMAYELGQLHMQQKCTRLLPAIMMMAADEMLLQEGALVEEAAVPEAMGVEEDGPADSRCC